jgi:hypothetical protein
VSTTADEQKSVVVGYYGKIENQLLQYAVDTIVIKKGVMPLPNVGYHNWHKANDTLWRDYFYFSTTGIKYQGTFVKCDSFCVYVNNKVEVDTLSAWSPFFRVYERLGIHMSIIYQGKLSTQTVHTTMVPLIQVKHNIIKHKFMLNGRGIPYGNSKHCRNIRVVP